MAEEMTEDEARSWSPPYVPREGRGLMYPGMCCAYARGDGFYRYQCGKPIKARYGALGYCGIHDPAKIKARREKAAEKRKEEAEEYARRYRESDRKQKLRLEALDVLKIIARGHNDPRALARDTLEKFREPWDEQSAIPPENGWSGQDEAG